jgi:hypothetical protein
VLAHLVYLFDVRMVPDTDPGYLYTVVIHPGPVNVVLSLAVTDSGALSGSLSHL